MRERLAELLFEDSPLAFADVVSRGAAQQRQRSAKPLSAAGGAARAPDVAVDPDEATGEFRTRNVVWGEGRGTYSTPAVRALGCIIGLKDRQYQAVQYSVLCTRQLYVWYSRCI